MWFGVKRCQCPPSVSGTFLVPVTGDADTAELPGRLPTPLAAWEVCLESKNEFENMNVFSMGLITIRRTLGEPIPAPVVTLQQFYARHIGHFCKSTKFTFK